MLAMLLGAIDQTIVATALPTIGRELNDVEHLPWVVTAYLLTATAVTPLYGKLSDIIGRRGDAARRHRRFPRRVGALRAGADNDRADRARALSGARRRRPDLARPDHRRRHHPAARAHALPGLFRLGVRHLQHRRAGARRLLRRTPALVVHLLDQPAARRVGARHDQRRASPPAAARAAAPARRHRRADDGGGGERAAARPVLGRQRLSLGLARSSACWSPRRSPGCCSPPGC